MPTQGPAPSHRVGRHRQRHQMCPPPEEPSARPHSQIVAIRAAIRFASSLSIARLTGNLTNDVRHVYAVFMRVVGRWYRCQMPTMGHNGVRWGGTA